MAIQFTQYLRPDGRTKPVSIDRPKSIEDMAREISRKGYKFEVEVLSTLEVSVTVTHPDDGDVFIRIYPNDVNGAGAAEAIDALVTEAHQSLCLDH